MGCHDWRARLNTRPACPHSCLSGPKLHEWRGDGPGAAWHFGMHCTRLSEASRKELRQGLLGRRATVHTHSTREQPAASVGLANLRPMIPPADADFGSDSFSLAHAPHVAGEFSRWRKNASQEWAARTAKMRCVALFALASALTPSLCACMCWNIRVHLISSLAWCPCNHAGLDHEDPASGCG